MDFDSIAFASQGEASLLVFRCPEELSQNGSEVECYALAILPRTNGMLLCLPRNVISEEAMIAALGAGEEGLLGPTKLIQAPLCEESEDGTTVTTSGPHRYMYLVDFNLEVLQYLQEYDPIIVGDAITPFDQEVPNAIPVSSTVLEIASVWVSEQGFARANFYSAREEQEVPSEPGPKAPTKATSKKAGTPKRISNAQVMEQLAQMASQIQALAMRQETAEQSKAEGAGPTLQAERAFGSIQPVPAVSAGLGTGGVPPLGAVAKALQLVGPPPRTRQGRTVHQDPEPVEQEVQDPFKAPALGIVPKSGIEAALAQQSTAITTLVAHLASQADPLGDLSSTAVSSSSTKGVQRRERLQNELASRNSTFYLQVMQQVHRRLHPGRPAPKVEADLAGLSFLSYLEKNGGFRHHRDAGLQMWLMGHVMEAAATDDVWLMKERLALAVVALDQSVSDQGDWTLGYLLSLAEDPPIALFQEKTSTTSPFGKPFSALVPPTWAAICLAYVKELETLTTRKAEASPKRNKDAKPDDPSGPPSPKRKPRFPKKPKADAPAH